MGKILLYTVLILSLFSCTSKEILELGFVADFSSGQSMLGVQCRNAVLLAIEDINAQGGILGREVVLRQWDNKNDPTNYTDIVNEMVGSGIQFVIGPHLSKMAPSFLDKIRDENIIAFSPVVSSDLFNGIDDNFFLIQPRSSHDGGLVGQAIVDKGNESVALVRNFYNEIYTDAFMDGVRKVLNENSVEILYDKAFVNEDQYQRVVSELLSLEAEALVFSARGIEPASIIQQYAKSKPLPQLYSDEWCKTTDLVKYGGKTVDGMISPGVYNNHRDSSIERDLLNRYESIYSQKPILFTSYAYETIMLIQDALEKAGKNYTVPQVKDILLEIDDFEGIVGPLEFNLLGDSQREKILYIIKDSKYVPF